MKAVVNNDFGYPLLQITDIDMSISYYYPTINMFTPPTLIKGQPYILMSEDSKYAITLFIPDDNGAFPYLLHVKKYK